MLHSTDYVPFSRLHPSVYLICNFESIAVKSITAICCVMLETHHARYWQQLQATVMQVKMCCAKCEEKAIEECEEVDGKCLSSVVSKYKIKFPNSDDESNSWTHKSQDVVSKLGHGHLSICRYQFYGFPWP